MKRDANWTYFKFVELGAIDSKVIGIGHLQVHLEQARVRDESIKLKGDIIIVVYLVSGFCDVGSPSSLSSLGFLLYCLTFVGAETRHGDV